jgi:hypothetical protein
MTARTLDERVTRATSQLGLILAAVTANGDRAVLDVAAEDVNAAVFDAALDALNALQPLRLAPDEIRRWTPAPALQIVSTGGLR